MRLALIADEYVPARTSVAVQMRDLAQELIRQGHEPTVIIPAANLPQRWALDHVDGVEVLRLRAPQTKDIGHARRAIAEFRLPYAMRRGLSTSPLAATRWDGIAWYSPTIFFGPLIRWLKKRSGCRTYLILRDLFPDWAVDTGVMRRGPAYYLLKLVERQQYRAADVIGVQTPANLPYLERWSQDGARRIEVLHNWLAVNEAQAGAELAVFRRLERKTVFVYAGNMGQAQGMDCMIELAEALREQTDAVFLFIGRGSDVPRLKRLAEARSLGNVIFHEEVEPAELPGILARCDIGLLALDPRHTTHNIPGKFLTYLNSRLPVLARVNPGNDLIEMIDTRSVGFVSTNVSVQELCGYAQRLLAEPDLRRDMGRRGGELAEAMFCVERAAAQVVTGLRDGN
jgi:glycosyltransferase involved in cell wall biosynthesis